MILTMTNGKERILVVEPDLEISDLISRQTLIPLGYQVQVVGGAAQAIQEAVKFSPEVIIANLNLTGLSGKDLLVGLNAQGIDVPVIVIADKGMEGDVIQAFRLGAADFISQPVREAEVVTAVERVLSQTRARREKEQLSRQLNQMNQELQRRVRELTTIFAIGKAVTSITDPAALFDKIVEGSVFITEADLGWLHLRDDRSKGFILSAHKNLPASVAARLNQPWDDGLSSLVALSGESFQISGDPLKRFKVAQLGQSALVVPVKVKKEVVGLLVVMRKKPQAFTANNQALLEAVADYASISLVNVRLFREMENRVRTFQEAMEAALLSERIHDELCEKINLALQQPLAVIKGNLDLLSKKTPGPLTTEQAKLLSGIQEKWQSLMELLALQGSQLLGEAAQKAALDLNEVARKAAEQFQPIARGYGVTLSASLLQKPARVLASRYQLAKAIEGLLFNALHSSQQGGKITLRLELTPDNTVKLAVQDHGVGIEAKNLPHVFEAGYNLDAGAQSAMSLGISLASIKDIVTMHGGKVGVESKPGSGSVFSFTLPLK